MESILQVVYKKIKMKMNPLEQGDCAHIQGFISDFYGTREIWAFTMCILTLWLLQIVSHYYLNIIKVTKLNLINCFCNTP